MKRWAPCRRIAFFCACLAARQCAAVPFPLRLSINLLASLIGKSFGSETLKSASTSPMLMPCALQIAKIARHWASVAVTLRRPFPLPFPHSRRRHGCGRHSRYAAPGQPVEAGPGTRRAGRESERCSPPVPGGPWRAAGPRWRSVHQPTATTTHTGHGCARGWFPAGQRRRVELRFARHIAGSKTPSTGWEPSSRCLRRFRSWR